MSKYDFLYPMDIPEEDKSLFEAIGYNYKEKNYIFDLVRMSQLDAIASGEVYKMSLRIKDRKGGNEDSE